MPARVRGLERGRRGRGDASSRRGQAGLRHQHRLRQARADAHRRRPARAAAAQPRAVAQRRRRRARSPTTVVRLMLLLKVASLARGYSGVRAGGRRRAARAAQRRRAAGASRRRARSARRATWRRSRTCSAVLIGVGEVRHRRPRAAGRARRWRRRARAARARRRRKAWRCSTARRSRPRSALHGLFAARRRCSPRRSSPARCRSMPPRAATRRSTRASTRCAASPARSTVAGALPRLLAGSADPRLAPAPATTGAGPVLPALPAAGDGRLPRPDATRRRASLLIEANGVSDNPLVFPDDAASRSPAATSTPSRSPSPPTTSRWRSPRSARSSERRIALLIDAALSAACRRSWSRDGGLNSGFMIAHVTAAALASREQVAAPTRRASIRCRPRPTRRTTCRWRPTRARRLRDMADNTARIVAIELLAAAQGIDFRARALGGARASRACPRGAPHLDGDRYLALDIGAVRRSSATAPSAYSRARYPPRSRLLKQVTGERIAGSWGERRPADLVDERLAAQQLDFPCEALAQAFGSLKERSSPAGEADHALAIERADRVVEANATVSIA